MFSQENICLAMLETIFCIHSWGCLVEDGFMLIACCFRKSIPTLLKSQCVNIHTFVHIPMKDLFLSSLQIKNVHLRISSNFPNFYIQISIYLGIFSYIFIFSYCLSWFFFAWTYFPLYFPSGSFKLSGFAAQSKIKTC